VTLESVEVTNEVRGWTFGDGSWNDEEVLLLGHSLTPALYLDRKTSESNMMKPTVFESARLH
jgi:hypothetical protein